MKEQFLIAASQDILKHIDTAADRAGLSRGQTFEDFLTFVRCSLAGQTMEEEYLQTVTKGYTKGTEGKRGIDIIARTFGMLVMAMEETQQDVLGDIFTGAISYGERGQFFTPDGVCELLAELTTGNEDDAKSKSVNDPACGSGRSLLAVAKRHPTWEFTGQDVDHRCVQMTAINLGLNGYQGWAVWQNTLSMECYRVYRIGFNLHGGVIREVPITESPFNYQAMSREEKPQEPSENKLPAPTLNNETEKPPVKQLDLF